MITSKKRKILLLTFFIIAAIIVVFGKHLTGWMHPDEKALREEVVTIAEQYLGCSEADGSHESIIDAYNRISPIPRGYKMQYEDSWCAAFVTVVGTGSSMADWFYPECSCQEMIYLFQNSGEWVENDWYIPQTGDLIFYAWDEWPLGECTGWADHVGIVVDVYGPIIKVIEGNKDDAVACRYIPIGHPQIRGYGLPDYHKAAACS